MHPREQHRPSSTGHLIHRVMPRSRHRLWQHDRKFSAADIRVPGRETWVLHPHGETMPAGPVPESIHVVLLDGAWSETATMARDTVAWGRRISLPMTGESRFWLRDQQEGARFSTVEALIFLLRACGLQAAGEALQLQLELHVYAHLRARGRKEAAEEFLLQSPLPAALPEVLAQLTERRRR